MVWSVMSLQESQLSLTCGQQVSAERTVCTSSWQLPLS